MQHPDEGTIHAWLDGELSAEEGVALEEHASACAECRAAIAEARGLVAASSRIVSSLDIVPGGVIPARAPVRRAWYSTAQFRAAAAVLFVAGASLVLTRGRDTMTLDEASEESAAALTLESPAAPEPGADAQAPAPVQAPSRDRDGAANRAAKAAAPAPAPAPQPSARRSAPPPVADIATGAVVTGAAAESREILQQSAPPVLVMAEELQMLRVDSTARVRTTVYRVPPGVEVLLTETILQEITATGKPQEKQLAEVRTMSRAPLRATAPAAAAIPDQVTTGVASAAAVPVMSIIWTDSTTKRVFRLSGPVVKERLEEIRKLIEQKPKP